MLPETSAERIGQPDTTDRRPVPADPGRRYPDSLPRGRLPARRPATTSGQPGCVSPYIRTRRTPRTAVAGVVGVLVVLGALATTVVVSTARGPLAGTPSAMPGPDAEVATSTPVAQWRAGTMPHLYQTDPAWADEPYAGATVAQSGCGPTCLTMVYVYLTGKTDYNPASMCVFSDTNGFVENGLTAWRLMTDGAQMLGLTGEELPADVSTLANALAAGAPVICSMRPGDFTQSGHFIALCGLDANGRAVVFDPNSAERSAKTWDLQTILDQCANLWTFSAA